MSSPTTRRARCCKRVMQSNVGRGRIRKEPTGEAWWADVLVGPRAGKRERRTDLAVKQAFYQLADERRETILVACSKCDWRAAFSRDELIASHSADYAMPTYSTISPHSPPTTTNWRDVRSAD